jgi:hypothetical protein
LLRCKHSVHISPGVFIGIIGDSQKVVSGSVEIFGRFSIIAPQDRCTAVIKISAIGRPGRPSIEDSLLTKLLNGNDLAL